MESEVFETFHINSFFPSDANNCFGWYSQINNKLYVHYCGKRIESWAYEMWERIKKKQKQPQICSSNNINSNSKKSRVCYRFGN